MKYYLIIIGLGLFCCNYRSSTDNNKHLKVDTHEKSFINGKNIKNNIRSNVPIVINDTVTEFLKENLYYSTIINLSFCQAELVELLNKNDSCKKEWTNKIKNLFTMYDDPIDTVSTGIEISFFKNRLRQQNILRNEYPDGYDFLMNSLPSNLDTFISSKKYRAMMLRFKNASGGNFYEISDIYYTFLIVSGLNFTNAIENSPECVILFRKWINNLEETEFVAYGADNVPPQILERKRNYLVSLYSYSSDSLMREAIDKIKKAKIRLIN